MIWAIVLLAALLVAVASVVGPGMESLMRTNGMLERSANDTYMRALEQHVYQVDRMLGRVP